MAHPDVLIAGRYRLVERIASGGMGSVWEAWDERLQRRVALKQLHPQPGLSRADAELVASRAMREARITARLHHAHAVPVYDVIDLDGQPCLIMQYLPSKSLQTLVRERGSLSVPEVARIGSQVAAALTAAHAVGIVHRDVKPGNVLIAEDGTAKLTDFGISHAAGDPALTSTGMVTGTPAFLAPEVARGADSTPASDVFSLGSTLYAALEGSPPFGTHENPMAMLHRVASGQATPPQRSGPLSAVLSRMLAPDAAARPPMQEVAGTLAAAYAALSDPAAAERTQRIVAPPPHPVVPPSATVTLPAVGAEQPPFPVGARPAGGAPPGKRRRRLTAIGALALLLVLGLAVVLAIELGGGDGGSPPAAGGASSPVHHSASVQHTSRAPSTQPSTPPSTPTTSAPSTTAQHKHKQKPAGAAERGELVSAVRDYYALLPDNTDAAWQKLTPQYQHSAEAGGRANYNSFWNGIDSVSVSGERADPAAQTVVATVRYVQKGGGSSSEQRSFRLVRQGKDLKIADSSVVS